ncbi:hypothetical protein E3Q22_02865 [Wallemia mellicola]|uniref:Clathrin light chain n=1 Tax=Wallemia mellicola TaxID=1708541 RepID=A0A4V4N0M1_9BASI|nr:hypothetical protein E3Q22_02865 [Wallemia mellicola]TIC10772.1 hypothetical protein E3Q14_02626 [Wallemia mellicola]TIC29455.1 hypothetical protein E3Q10_02560 [Wallemia mellicola]TIC53983.1 hypothetical protein E3Q05_02213 [Wallemia mellicola]
MSADLLGDETDNRLDPEVAASAFPNIEGVDGADEKFPEIPATGEASASPVVAAPLEDTPKDDIQQFESSFPALEEPEVSTGPEISTPSFVQSDFIQQTPSNQGIAAPLFSARTSTDPEPEPVREWREKRAKEIAERDTEAEKEKDEIKLKAERAIDSFYKDYNERKEKNIAKNKEDEQEFLNKRTDALASGTTWERICDLLDIDNVGNKQLARKDLGRFKEVLTGLRKQGERAPGAGGY